MTGTTGDQASGPQQTPESEALRARMSASGMVLEYHESGLVWRGHADLCADLIHPSKEFPDLASRIELLGRFARALQAGDVEPL